MKINKSAIRISLYYLVFGLLWILFSDQLVEFLASRGLSPSFLQTVKGSVFVIVTALLLYKVANVYISRIEEEAKKVRTYLDNIGVLVFSLDENGNIIFINDKGCEMLDCSSDSIKGKNLLKEVIPERYEEEVKSKLEELYRSSDLTCTEFVCPITCKNVKEAILSWSCYILQSENGKGKELLCSGTDITSKLTMEKLANKMLHVVEQSPNSVIITDINGDIEYVNRKFVELTGYTFDEVNGKNPRILKSGKTDPETYNELWSKITRGEPWEGELCNKKKNGEFYWEYAKISPLKDPDTGEILNFIGIKEDITYEKKLEAELLHSQKMEAIGNLAGGIAHDFNNVLTAIIGYGNILLLKLNENDPLKFYVEQILAASERAATLTQNLLTFARKQPAMKRAVNLNEVVTRISKMLVRIMGEHIELTTHFAEEEFNIYADPVQIEQILMNLASNARDAMSESGVFSIETQPFKMDEVFIKQNGFGREGEYVLLKVSDTGCGMDEHTLNHLFEPFFTTKETGKGTGLGLSIVYGIVKAHNGYITVESEKGMGTVFYIYFPVTKRIREPYFDFHRTEKFEIEGKEAVLLAEDDKTVREMIKDYLESSGYKVFTATDGEEAVEIFKEHIDEIAICLLDVVMPKKSGINAFKEIKMLNPKIRAVIMSGYKTEIERDVDEFGGDVCFIQKPVSPSELMGLARELLDKQ